MFQFSMIFFYSNSFYNSFFQQKRIKPIFMRTNMVFALPANRIFSRRTMSTKESRLASSIVVWKKNWWIELQMQEINIISSDLLITLLTFFSFKLFGTKRLIFSEFDRYGHWNWKNYRNSLIPMDFCEIVWNAESNSLLFIVADI